MSQLLFSQTVSSSRGFLANPNNKTTSKMSDTSNNFFSSIKGSIKGRLSRSASNASQKSANDGNPRGQPQPRTQSRPVSLSAGATSGQGISANPFANPFSAPSAPPMAGRKYHKHMHNQTLGTDILVQQQTTLPRHTHLQHRLRPTSRGRPVLRRRACPPSRPPRPRTSTPSCRLSTPFS